MSLLSRESRNTLWRILAVGIGLIVWDVVLLRDGVEDTTISAVMRILSRLLFFPYGFGVLAGHVGA